jgi:hypothetical protein
MRTKFIIKKVSLASMREVFPAKSMAQIPRRVRELFTSIPVIPIQKLD